MREGEAQLNRIEDLVSAIRLFRKLASTARGFADGCFGEWDRVFREKCLRKERIRLKAVQRLSRVLTKELDAMKEHYK